MRMLARGDLDDRQFAELRALLAAPRKRALPLNDGISGPDNSDGGGDSLAQAVHDLCRAAGADCNPTNIPDTPYRSRKARNMTVKEALALSRSTGNLTVSEIEAMGCGRRRNLSLSEAARMLRG
jgi:hypothetical protein